MSTTRVSFYVLSGPDAGNRLGYACRVMEKAYKLQHRIHAHTADGSMARSLDALLWTFRQGSFVPHEVLAPDAGEPRAPVTIGAADTTNPAPPAADLLVNLAPDVPAFFQQFPRIADFIDGSPAGIEAGRARYRFYRTHGLELETHEVS